MDIFYYRYYKLNYLLLMVIGQWPYQSRRTMLVLRVTISLIFLSGIIVMVFKYIAEDFNIDLFVEIVLYVVALIIFWLKYLSYWINTDKVMLLIEEIEHEWKAEKSKEVLKILENSAEETRSYNLYCVYYALVVSCVGAVSVAVPTILNLAMPLDEPRPREFLFQGNYFVDPQIYYYPILLHMTVCLGTGLIVLVATDTMYATYVHHACTLFSIAGYYFEHMFDTALETRREQEIFVKIRSGVEYHKKAMRFANDVNSLYDWVMFVTLLLVIGNISLTLYYVVVDTNGLFNVMRAAASMVTQMGQLFFDVYPGQKLINSSANVIHKVYNSKWYVTPAGTQKLLITIMRASMTPSQIIPGGLFVFSSETYSSVMQTAISYFTVLHSTR